MTDLPYPDDQARTHFDRCWSSPGHHNCAVREIDQLRELLDQARQEIYRLSKRLQANPLTADFEAHAALEHDIWGSWMYHMFSQGTMNPDGTWTMPAWAVERWTRQMNESYHNLSEKEKESDREQVRKHLSLIQALHRPVKWTW
jgi:hypothetical protein